MTLENNSFLWAGC